MRNNVNSSMRKGEKAFFAMADLYGGGGQAMIGEKTVFKYLF